MSSFVARAASRRVVTPRRHGFAVVIAVVSRRVATAQSWYVSVSSVSRQRRRAESHLPTPLPVAAPLERTRISPRRPAACLKPPCPASSLNSPRYQGSLSDFPFCYSFSGKGRCSFSGKGRKEVVKLTIIETIRLMVKLIVKLMVNLMVNLVVKLMVKLMVKLIVKLIANWWFFSSTGKRRIDGGYGERPGRL